MPPFPDPAGANLRDLVECLARRIAARAYRHAHPGRPDAEAQAYARQRWAGYVIRGVWALSLLGGCQRAWRAAPLN
jgi:hypothetical protein